MFGLLKKFQVCFDRDTSEQVTLEVEACTEAEAIELARGRLCSEEAADLEWEATDFAGDAQLIFIAEDLQDEC